MFILKMNMKYIIFILTLSGFCTTAKAQSLTLDTNVLRMDTIISGDKGYASIRFTNTGMAPLILNSVKTSDGGFYVDSWPKSPIAPGESSQINFVYYTEHRSGNFGKVATISSNDKSQQMAFLRIKGYD